MGSIRILLVEDEAPKANNIIRFLGGLDLGLSTSVCRSVNSALDAIEDGHLDLILLDMSLPTFDVGERETGGRPQGFGGKEILRYMSLSEIYKPVIIVTGYEAFSTDDGRRTDLSEMSSELHEEFPDIVRGVLHYNSTFDAWQTNLRSFILELVPTDRGLM